MLTLVTNDHHRPTLEFHQMSAGNKHYFHSQMRLGFAPLQEQLVVVSSLKFIKFVAYETAETLQPDSQYNKPVLLGLEMN